jgi:hypothetical protein
MEGLKKAGLEKGTPSKRSRSVSCRSKDKTKDFFAPDRKRDYYEYRYYKTNGNGTVPH